MAKQRITDREGGVPANDNALALKTSVRRSTVPADADAHAFRAAMRDVKPLKQSPAPMGLEPDKPRARRKPVAPHDSREAVPLDMPLIEPGAEAPAISGGEALTFQRPGVRNQVLRKLRRGLYAVEDDLDLHGLSQAAARDRLSAFLAHSRDAGRRCVRIIHGKGYRSGARGPVLKIAVDLWLRRHIDVMAFASARPIDGGTGAVYVLLRS